MVPGTAKAVSTGSTESWGGRAVWYGLTKLEVTVWKAGVGIAVISMLAYLKGKRHA